MRHKAIITRIAHRRVEKPVDNERSGCLVHLVLYRLAADRNFDDYIDVIGWIVADMDRIYLHFADLPIPRSCCWRVRRRSAASLLSSTEAGSRRRFCRNRDNREQKSRVTW